MGFLRHVNALEEDSSYENRRSAKKERKNKDWEYRPTKDSQGWFLDRKGTRDGAWKSRGVEREKKQTYMNAGT